MKHNGEGATSLIQRYINRSGLPADLVQEKLLNGLNEIFLQDCRFTGIVAQLHDTNLWEIYLQEEGKGRIPLSNSGSGLKTVILVLANLILIPHVDDKDLSGYVFGFEELENNLHPALLRRLNDFLYSWAVEHDFVYFVTTHSNVLIDQFSQQDDAQIIHVRHHEGVSSAKTVSTYIDNHGVLDDLDVRASDLLQANGIVWVEGPSDRIYLNQWIHLWSGGELREGTHYQIVFYGGRLLSHLSGAEPDQADESISLLKTNRNSMIVIDSDKRSQQARINASKRRIVSEFQDNGLFSWVTKGREIENYISNAVGRLLISNRRSAREFNSSQYVSFFDSLNSVERGLGDKYAQKKPLMAERLVPNMTKENCENVLDLDARMRAVCEVIRSWNGLS